ncbi:protein kinase domain-containing protein [Micromonospora chersina]|uniref:protein kinase domain-containing protein n=1 Tax=Micromonospora chersina TaxID=47854 RepID=UPI003692C9D6
MGEVIGRGGIAEVRVGRDIHSGRRVAIKALRKDLAHDPLFRSSLRREALAMARLRHPSIAAIHDTGYDEVDGGPADTQGVLFIVMEHVAGWSLRDLLGMGGLTLEKSIQYQLGVLTALEVSHRAGIVHRDIKPANVMVTFSGAVKLVDFGIACASGDPAAITTHIRSFLGTPTYFSPEQARGEAADARSDLYSAGCLLFELHAGRPPFTGDDPISVAHQHVHERPPRADTGIPALDDVIAKALSKPLDERFQTARAFRDALRAATTSLANHHDAGIAR